MGALRIWLTEDTQQVKIFFSNLFLFIYFVLQYDAYLHNLWLSRLRTMIVVSDEDKHLNRTLLYAKLFYFWYFAAFGSLFPLLSIYFKQMGMGPSYCGVLMGFR